MKKRMMKLIGMAACFALSLSMLAGCSVETKTGGDPSSLSDLEISVNEEDVENALNAMAELGTVLDEADDKLKDELENSFNGKCGDADVYFAVDKAEEEAMLMYYDKSKNEAAMYDGKVTISDGTVKIEDDDDGSVEFKSDFKAGADKCTVDLGDHGKGNLEKCDYSVMIDMLSDLIGDGNTEVKDIKL